MTRTHLKFVLLSALLAAPAIPAAEGGWVRPTARVLSEGGYETRGLYRGVGLFDPSVETAVMNAVTEMARAAGRRTR